MNQTLPKSLRIALVDDHILIRDALANIVDSFEDCTVCILASNGREFIDKLQFGIIPHLVILDLMMPEMDGYETAKWLRSNYPDMYILMLSMYDSELATIRLLQSGVRGFLKKDVHPSELQQAIETTMRTGYYYSSSTSTKLVKLLKTGDSKTPLVNSITLNEKEMQFLKLASADMTYKEIAQIMEMRPRTIDNYRDALFTKLNVKSRVGLVLFAIKNGVVSIGY